MPLAHSIIPLPVSFEVAEGGAFTVAAATRIVVDPGVDEAARIGEYLGAILRPSTGHPLSVSADAGASSGAIALRLVPDETLGDEGYRMAVSADSVRLTAHRPAGLFRGVQTLRQLLPATIELAAHAPRWHLLGINYYRSPQVPWPE
jgi:hexosaminidase